MINRREFLKLSGMASAALAGGFSAGKLFNETIPEFNFAALIPAEEYSIKSALDIFYNKIQLSSKPFIDADKQAAKIINRSVLHASKIYSWKNADVFIKAVPINSPANGDILLSSRKENIVNPENYSDKLNLFRSYLKNKKADFLLTAECKKSSFFSFSENKSAVIENESGVYEKINLNSEYKKIIIPGRNGKVTGSIKEGRVKIVSAPCRHKICMQINNAANAGDYIACAPNKILIRIENA